MAETTNRAKTAPQNTRGGRPASAAGSQLSVRYWKRMRPNKVYPVFVTSTGSSDLGPVTLRLVAAGAQVVPAEQEFDTGNAREQVIFYVTPLAKNGLRGERLEVLQGGMKIQEIRLPSKVCTQGSTWFWLFLALFLPWLILHYLVYSPVGFEEPVKHDGTHVYVVKPSVDYGKDDKKYESKRITDFMKANTPDLKPVLGDSKDLKDGYEEIQAFPEFIYVRLVRGYNDLNEPLAFYLFLLFLILALVSCLFRREARKTARGRMLPMGGE